jgi:hypothetical protein
MLSSLVTYVSLQHQEKGIEKLMFTCERTHTLTEIVVAIAGIPQFLNQLLEGISRRPKETDTFKMPHLVPRVVLNPIDEVCLLLKQV